jgi:hypothetical protein
MRTFKYFYTVFWFFLISLYVLPYEVFCQESIQNIDEYDCRSNLDFLNINDSSRKDARTFRI